MPACPRRGCGTGRSTCPRGRCDRSSRRHPRRSGPPPSRGACPTTSPSRTSPRPCCSASRCPRASSRSTDPRRDARLAKDADPADAVRGAPGPGVPRGGRGRRPAWSSGRSTPGATWASWWPAASRSRTSSWRVTTWCAGSVLSGHALADALARRCRPRGARAASRRPWRWCAPRSGRPMESRARLMFVHAGFPEPEVNADVFDAHGGWLLEGDLVWRRQRVVGEYQGVDHASIRRRSADASRATSAEAEDYRILEIYSEDVFRGGTPPGLPDAASPGLCTSTPLICGSPEARSRSHDALSAGRFDQRVAGPRRTRTGGSPRAPERTPSVPGSGGLDDGGDDVGDRRARAGSTRSRTDRPGRPARGHRAGCRRARRSAPSPSAGRSRRRTPAAPPGPSRGCAPRASPPGRPGRPGSRTPGSARRPGARGAGGDPPASGRRRRGAASSDGDSTTHRDSSAPSADTANGSTLVSSKT